MENGKMGEKFLWKLMIIVEKCRKKSSALIRINLKIKKKHFTIHGLIIKAI